MVKSPISGEETLIMFENYKNYTVGYIRYSDMTEHRQHVSAESEGAAIRMIQAATWKFGYDEYYIVEDEDE